MSFLLQFTINSLCLPWKFIILNFTENFHYLFAFGTLSQLYFHLLSDFILSWWNNNAGKNFAHKFAPSKPGSKTKTNQNANTAPRISSPSSVAGTIAASVETSSAPAVQTSFSTASTLDSATSTFAIANSAIKKFKSLSRTVPACLKSCTKINPTTIPPKIQKIKIKNSFNSPTIKLLLST